MGSRIKALLGAVAPLESKGRPAVPRAKMPALDLGCLAQARKALPLDLSSLEILGPGNLFGLRPPTLIPLQPETLNLTPHKPQTLNPKP